MDKKLMLAAAVQLAGLCFWSAVPAEIKSREAALLRGSSETASGAAMEATEAASLSPEEAARLDLQGPRLCLSAEGNPLHGPEKAAVDVVVFSDFQCPHCERLEPLLDQISRRWPAEVRVVFKSFPLASHPAARLAAEASLAAGAQGKYFPMRERLFAFFAERQGPLTRERLGALAAEAGLDAVEFDRGLDTGRYAPDIQKDIEEGASVGVSSVPALFVDGWRWDGERTIEALRPAVELLLAAKGLRQVRTVTRTSGRDDGVCDEDCSLAEAIVAANSRRGPEIIRLPPGRWPVWPEELPLVSDDLTIAGDPEGATVLETDARGTVFWTSGPKVLLSLAGLTVASRTRAGGSSGFEGGAGASARRGARRQPLRPSDCTTQPAPMAARDLRLAGSETTTLTWAAPENDTWPGTYDVLRGESASDFYSAACLQTNIWDLTAQDTEPFGSSTGVWYYLVRSRNTCGTNLGYDSDDWPRDGLVCTSDDGPCDSDGECNLSPCCSGWCADLQNDWDHCGDCDTQCSDACCFGSCADLQNDTNNCGYCGNTCPDACCSGSCADLQNDASNCGYCGNACADSCCSGSCADLQSDPANCGYCGNACADTCCSGSCADLQSDPNNCGYCGNACSDTCCSGSCADLQNDPNNCGVCGRVCTSGVCEGGECQEGAP